MLHTDLMKFKDEMLKNLREIELKIMNKVNKTQEKFSLNLTTLSSLINSLQISTNSILGEITEQKLNINKIFTIESDLKKYSTSLISQEQKINDSLVEITYLRNRLEKSLADSLLVPGCIGKNCKYSSFNDYIMNNIKDMNRLKAEKDFEKKENREMRQKFEQSIKNLSNLFDSFFNRSKMYTDTIKKSIIELIDSKISDLDAKNIELLAKICKLDDELEQKIKIFEDNLKNLNKNENDYNQKVEDKLISITNNIEEINKKINETKDELNAFKNREEKYINELDTIKNNVNTILQNDNNNEIYINSDDIKLSKEINNITNEIKNDNNNLNNNQSLLNIINKANRFKENNINENSVEKDNNNTVNNSSTRVQLKSELNNDIPLNQKQLNLILKRFKNKENLIIKGNQKLKLNFNNNINNANSTFNNFHKNMKFSNPELISFVNTNKKKSTNITLRERDITRKSFDKNINTINKPINHKKKLFFNFKKNFDVKLDEFDFYQNKKEKKEKPMINTNPNQINKSNNKKDKFPMIKEKIYNNLLINNEGIFFPKNLDNNFIIFHSSKKNKNSNKNNKSNNYSVDKETGVGYNVVKLSFEDDSITPYNTNGLITMTSNQLLNRRLNKSEEGMSFSFDNIFSNIYQYQTKRKNILNKKPKCHKTIQTFYGKNKINFEKVLNTIDNNIKKEFSKKINNISFDNDIIRYNINKK